MPGAIVGGSWDIIPYELLYKIFSYLEVQDLVCSVQYVCSRWMQVSHDSRLWKTLVYSPHPHSSAEDVLEFLEDVPQLKHFSLGAHREADRIVERLPDYCPDIEVLSVHYSRHGCSSQGLVKLLFCLEKLLCLEISLKEIDEELLGSFWLAQNLQSLSLKFTTCDGNVHKLLSHVVQNCYSLQELKISFHRDLFDSDLKVLVQKVNRLLTYFAYSAGDGFTHATSNIFSQCTSMKSLVIKRPWFCDNIYDLKYIGKLPPLESLAIYRMNVVPDALTQLFLDNNWDKLVKLDIVGTSGFENGSLVHVFSTCPNLQYLNFSDSSLSDEGFQYACHYGSRLKRLSVKGTNLTDAGLENLHHCSCLAALSIEDCRFLTGNAAHHLIKCARLTELVVSSNDWVTDEIVRTLLLCPRLEYLTVDFCNNITVTCFENVSCLPHNFHRIKIFCTSKLESQNLMGVAAGMSYLSVSP